MELDRLEKRIRALQARKVARAATLERVQGIDPTEHEAAVYHAIHEDIAADAHTYYNLPVGVAPANRPLCRWRSWTASRKTPPAPALLWCSGGGAAP